MAGERTLIPNERPQALIEFTYYDALTYDVSDLDWVFIQLMAGDDNAWPSGAVVTVDASNGRGRFDPLPSGAITATAFGPIERIAVDSLLTLRIKTSTKAAGGTYRPIVRGSRDA